MQKKDKALQLHKSIKNDLEKQISEQATYSSQLIKGQGIKQLDVKSDILNVLDLSIQDLTKFLDALLPTIQIQIEQKNRLKKFFSILPKSKINQFRKFEFIKTDSKGKGSWIGIFFRKINEQKCEFYLNHIKCAFTLVPDVYVIKQSTSTNFIGIKTTSENVYLVEKSRGLTREDVNGIMAICTAVTGQKLAIE